MDTRIAGRLGAFVLAAAYVGTVTAKEESRSTATAIGEVIESCVDASTIRFRPDDRHALLDDADAETVRAAIAKRYPKVEDDGLAPQRVVLWRHPAFGWVYVALLVNPAKAGQVCFTASFGADKFEMSPTLIGKYFGTTM